MYQATVYSIFIASPGDVKNCRKIAVEVIHKWNELNAKYNKIVLLPIRYEVNSRLTARKKPQEAINEQCLDDCDLMIAIFGDRLGTPTDNAISGTAEEVERHVQNGKDALIFFSSARVSRDLSSEAKEQLEKLMEYRENWRNQAYVGDFKRPQELRSQIDSQLALAMNDFISKYKTNCNEQGQIPETACLTSLSEYEKHLLRSALKNSKYEFETHSNNSGFSIKIRYIGELNKNGSCESSLNYESAIKQLVDKKFVDKTDEKRYGSVVIATYKVTKAGRDAIESFLTEVEKFRLKLTQKEYWTLYNIFQCIDISANEEEWKISLKSDLSNRGWIAPKPYISYEYRLFPYDRDSFLLLRKLLFSITQRGWATESQGL